MVTHFVLPFVQTQYFIVIDTVTFVVSVLDKAPSPFWRLARSVRVSGGVAQCASDVEASCVSHLESVRAIDLTFSVCTSA
jgi:hypothetical protein